MSKNAISIIEMDVYSYLLCCKYSIRILSGYNQLNLIK